MALVHGFFSASLFTICGFKVIWDDDELLHSIAVTAVLIYSIGLLVLGFTILID